MKLQNNEQQKIIHTKIVWHMIKLLPVEFNKEMEETQTPILKKASVLYSSVYWLLL